MKTTYSASWQEDGGAAVPGRLEVTPEAVAFTPAGGEEPQEVRLADVSVVRRRPSAVELERRSGDPIRIESVAASVFGAGIEAIVARAETLHGLRAEHGSFEEELRELRAAVQVLPELTDVRCHEFGLVATDLMRRIVRHAHVEELEVYPAVERLPGGGPLVDAMLFDHRAIEEEACELARVDRDDRACLMREFHRLDALVTTHMAKEETIVFPLLDA
jgi:hemerythrin-like domain-containing protein